MMLDSVLFTTAIRIPSVTSGKLIGAKRINGCRLPRLFRSRSIAAPASTASVCTPTAFAPAITLALTDPPAVDSVAAGDSELAALRLAFASLPEIE